ncbi:MAG: hypothetical protein M1827_005055 [Pycnora praestabilis]|nr:MAG: hypothetical protein M1827_005055 [Pycnora praestabilis]
MFPPVETSTLRQYPQFQQLHAQLTSSILNPNGSTGDEVLWQRQNVVKEVYSCSQDIEAPSKLNDTTSREFQIARTSAAKSTILRKSLGSAGSRSNELPDELQDVIVIIAMQLNTRLGSEDHEILEDDEEYFLDHIRPIGQNLSAYLIDLVLRILRVAHPEEPSAQKLRDRITILPQRISLRRKELLEKEDAIAAERLVLASTACSVLEAHRNLLEAIIRVLEQTKHGSVSRGVKAHAEYLAVVTENMEAKLRVMKHEALSEVYTPDILAALRNYEEHLQDTTIRLRQQEKAARSELDRYGAVGEDMYEIASRYSGILKDTENVRGDIRRLGGEA